MRKIAILISGLFTLLILNFGCGNKSTKSQDESLATENKSQMETNKLYAFGIKYAEAWCSQKPENVASFFSDNGSLTVNNSTPAVGRIAIAKVAEGFMIAFPDMIVAMDSLTTTSNGLEFHWTLTGTNTGPDATGNKVRISGFELWRIDKDGLIAESKGSFDAEEYNQQLKYGVTN